MAMFMLNDKLTICVKATRLTHENGYAVAWYEGECSAFFKASEIVGCWLDCGVKLDGGEKK
jgi:hypothetical protein